MLWTRCRWSAGRPHETPGSAALHPRSSWADRTANTLSALTMPKLAVRPMGTPDAAPVRAIGAAADQRFRGTDDPRIAACADHSPITIEALGAAIDAGRAWLPSQNAAPCAAWVTAP